MSRYHVELATPADDAALRAFLNRSEMPGAIELSFRRDPDYFTPAGAFGPFRQTIVCRDQETGEIVGTGCRSVRSVYVDGAPTPIGYLSMLRSAERVRNGLLLARGYRFLRELHGDGRAPCYLTTIADGNDTALDVLTSGRGPLPTYRPAGRYLTFAVATGGWRFGRQRRSVDAGAAGPVDAAGDLDEVLAFLTGHAKSRQFFPVWDRGDVEGPSATFTGLSRRDLFVHRDGGGRVTGTMGLWDQRRFRQTVVAGYRGPLRRLRPAYNATAALRRRPRLPDPGEQLDYGYAAMMAVEDDDPSVFGALLAAVCARARSRGLDTVLLGCHETDPLCALLERRSFLTYQTHFFVVSWPDSPAGGEPPHDRTIPLHLEVGCL